MSAVLQEALRDCDRLIAKKMASKTASEVPGDAVLQYLFDKERHLADDWHRFVTACCGRRGGKTTSVAAMMLRAAKKHPRRTVLYLTLTADQAEINIWPTLVELNAQFGLGGVPHKSDLSLAMPNGATIYLRGVDKQKEIEKRRGAGFSLVIIDECQSLPEYLRQLVDDIIAPALVDVPGRLVMIGTPSVIPSGYWWECHHNRKTDKEGKQVWGHHAWTLFENPTLPDPEASLEAECARRGVTRENVSIQREWFGKWVRDTESAVFAFDEVRNVYEALPLELDRGLYRYIIGVDLGGGVERDNDAISVLAYHPFSRTTWLTEEHISAKQDVTGVSLKVKAIVARLGEQNVDAVAVDTGGIGAKVSEEMARRHGLSTVAAKKADKWANIELLNGACRHGEFFARKESAFARECQKVEKDWSKSTPDKIVIKGHMPDICDSVLYAYVESYSWISKVPKQEPKPGSEEWAKEQERKMFQRAARDVAQAKRNVGDDFGGEMDDWGGGLEWSS